MKKKSFLIIITLILIMGMGIYSISIIPSDLNQTKTVNEERSNPQEDNIILWGSEPLSINDFKILEKSPDNEKKDYLTVAEISIRFENLPHHSIVSSEPCQYVIDDFEIRSLVDKDESWMNLDEAKKLGISKVLKHEQGHFDISEIYSRIFTKIIRNEILDENFICPISNNLSLESSISEEIDLKINSLELKLEKYYFNTQDNYENETHSGELDEPQNDWDDKIDTCLNLDFDVIDKCLEF